MHVAEVTDELRIVTISLTQLLAVVARVGENFLDRGALVGQQIEHLVFKNRRFRIGLEVAGLAGVAEDSCELLT